MPDGDRLVEDAILRWRAGEPEPPRRAARVRGVAVFLAAILGPAGVWFGAFALAAAGASDQLGPEECHGIGWGCTLTDRESVWFAAVAYGIFVVPFSTLVSVCVTAAFRADPGDRTGDAGAALLIALGVVALVLIVVSTAT